MHSLNITSKQIYIYLENNQIISYAIHVAMLSSNACLYEMLCYHVFAISKINHKQQSVCFG